MSDAEVTALRRRATATGAPEDAEALERALDRLDPTRPFDRAVDALVKRLPLFARCRCGDCPGDLALWVSHARAFAAKVIKEDADPYFWIVRRLTRTHALAAVVVAHEGMLALGLAHVTGWPDDSSGSMIGRAWASLRLLAAENPPPAAEQAWRRQHRSSLALKWLRRQLRPKARARSVVVTSVGIAQAWAREIPS